MSGWVLGDGGKCAVAEHGPRGVIGMIRVESPKNAAPEGGSTERGFTEVTWNTIYA